MNKELRQQALDALTGLATTIRHNAPELSGKIMGHADAAIAALSTRHVYHYFAEKLDGASCTRMDGIAAMRKQVVTMADYRDLKAAAVGEGVDASRWTLVSIAYLGEHPANLDYASNA